MIELNIICIDTILRQRGRKILNRIELLEKLITRNKAKTYFEIGIFAGTCFIPIQCELKIGVDVIPPVKEVQSILNDKTKYFQMTSDEFFEQHGSLFATNKIDAAFIDGYHSFGQSLRDVNNCLVHLSDNGVIVMHDCNPTTTRMATPFKSYEEKANARCTGDWTGDVWKTIVYLRSMRRDLNVMVLDADYGLGVITRGKPENMLPYTLEDIISMNYHDLSANRTLLLNLKSPDNEIF